MEGRKERVGNGWRESQEWVGVERMRRGNVVTKWRDGKDRGGMEGQDRAEMERECGEM